MIKYIYTYFLLGEPDAVANHLAVLSLILGQMVKAMVGEFRVSASWKVGFVDHPDPHPHWHI